MGRACKNPTNIRLFHKDLNNNPRGYFEGFLFLLLTDFLALDS